ncbi:MFS general substrate transporter [Cubamyces menziesii]|nr:MFS general substrate transporter [Cubamyces menziesii]
MDVELSTIRARSPHPPDEPVTPAATIEEGKRSEYVEAKPAEGSQSSHTPAATFSASTPASRRKARIQFTTLCWTLFLAGWNDGTTGPLLPRIRSVYHVGFAVVSLIFVFNCVGFVSGAAANVWLTDRFGFGTVMVIGAFAQVIGYALEAPAPPFPVFVLGYAVNGFGLSLQDAGANGFVASLKENAATKMGILHAIYGVGALSSPLVATQFAQLSRWSFHYLVSLGIALSNAILLIAVFRFKTQDACLAEIGQIPSHESGNEDGDANKYRQMFKLRVLHLMAFFILIYVGVEVTLGGWIVTYVIQLRGGGPSSGYISSGFFGGLTLGRVGLLWVGERRAIFLYGLLAVAYVLNQPRVIASTFLDDALPPSLELVIWLVPSLIGGGIAVSFVGVLLGPIYPIAGSAFLPFLTGALASRVGIKSLQPLLVSMMGFMIVLWALVPNNSRRVD